MYETTIYEAIMGPDATIEVEDSGNIVIATPERRITVTNVDQWVSELLAARQAVAMWERAEA